MDFKSMCKFWWNAMTKDIFNFNGKMSRNEYITFYLFSCVVSLLTLPLNIIFCIPAIWISIAYISATVRRYRELNKPVWYTVLNFIFLVQLYGFYLCFFVKGERN